VAGTETLKHERLNKGDSVPVNSHIYGPFEAGFSSRQDDIIRGWGCSVPSVVYDAEGGRDVGIAERWVAFKCNVQFPRIEGETYYGIVGPCGGHTHDYHFHMKFSCLYAASGGHSTAVGNIASHKMYGKWEDYDASMLPLLDACNGHFGPTPDSSGASVYHYHVTDAAPYTVGCFGPSKSGGLVSVQACRDLYDECDNDGGSGITIAVSAAESITYDRFCPCFDARGSNMGTNIQELPALTTANISYIWTGANSTVPRTEPTSADASDTVQALHSLAAIFLSSATTLTLWM
jgi:hypothetical protein